ncbi:MAG: hypothetical protein ACBR12_02060 [Microcoleus sp.]
MIAGEVSCYIYEIKSVSFLCTKGAGWDGNELNFTYHWLWDIETAPRILLLPTVIGFYRIC